MSSANNSLKEPRANTAKHTYTPRSHEELLRQFSRSAIENEDVHVLKRENDCLKRALENSNKHLNRLMRKISLLEENKIKQIGIKNSCTNRVTDPQSDLRSQIELNNDDEFVQSWEVLGNHFSEVIRRHHEVLAEKDKKIRELQENQYNVEMSNRLLNPQMNAKAITNRERVSKNKQIEESSGKISSENPNLKLARVERVSEIKMEKYAISDISESAEKYNSTDLSVYREDELMHSGEILSKHFSEVTRRHKEELSEKDRRIKELEEALRLCRSTKPPQKRKDDSEVQMWYHNYHSQPSIGTENKEMKTTPPKTNGVEDGVMGTASPSETKGEEHGMIMTDSLPETTGERKILENELSTRNYSENGVSNISPQQQTPLTSDDDDEDEDEEYEEEPEEERSITDSIDTFVAIEKCQRYESIANLERLRQNLLQRLALEEKLDKIYWQTELSRYETLREEAGDNFSPDCSFNKDFEMMETTRLELLRALNDFKDEAEKEPEMIIKPHVLFSESTSQRPVQLPESESKRRVQFKEEITITSVQTLYSD